MTSGTVAPGTAMVMLTGGWASRRRVSGVVLGGQDPALSKIQDLHPGRKGNVCRKAPPSVGKTP
jgi:hypothetical protein